MLGCTFVCLFSVFHEDHNAPQRRRHEEPKARPLRVGDTEKPGPESKAQPQNQIHLNTIATQPLCTLQLLTIWCRTDLHMRPPREDLVATLNMQFSHIIFSAFYCYIKLFCYD